ncbi:16724_t:CDS:1, partial [Racocetra persica]
AKIESKNDDEETIIDYSVPDIETRDKEKFKHIDNLDNSFG